MTSPITLAPSNPVNEFYKLHSPRADDEDGAVDVPTSSGHQQYRLSFSESSFSDMYEDNGTEPGASTSEDMSTSFYDNSNFYMAASPNSQDPSISYPHSFGIDGQNVTQRYLDAFAIVLILDWSLSAPDSNVLTTCSVAGLPLGLELVISASLRTARDTSVHLDGMPILCAI